LNLSSSYPGNDVKTQLITTIRTLDALPKLMLIEIIFPGNKK
jgi:hypothetical protein